MSEMKCINVLSMELDGNGVWFTAYDFNALFYADLNEGSYFYKGCFYESDDRTLLWNRRNQIVKKYGNKVFCFPWLGNRIWVYDIQQKKFRSILLDAVDNLHAAILGRALEHNQALYIISKTQNTLLKINPDKECVENVIDLSEYVKKPKVDWKYEDGKAYCLDFTDPVLCEIDLSETRIKSWKIPKLKEAPQTIEKTDKDTFWFSGWKKELYKWNRENNQVEIIEEFPNEFQKIRIADKEYPLFSSSVQTEEDIWFIPGASSHIVYVNKKTHKINIFHMLDEEKELHYMTKMPIGLYKSVYFRENRYIGLYSKRRILYEIDTKKYRVSEKRITMGQEGIDKLAMDIFADDTVHLERSEALTEVFLKCSPK